MAPGYWSGAISFFFTKYLPNSNYYNFQLSIYCSIVDVVVARVQVDGFDVLPDFLFAGGVVIVGIGLRPVEFVGGFVLSGAFTFLFLFHSYRI